MTCFYPPNHATVFVELLSNTELIKVEDGAIVAQFAELKDNWEGVISVLIRY